MERAADILVTLAAAGAMLRGLAAFDAGASASNNQPIASAILFVGGLAVLAAMRRPVAS